MASQDQSKKAFMKFGKSLTVFVVVIVVTIVVAIFTANLFLGATKSSRTIKVPCEKFDADNVFESVKLRAESYYLENSNSYTGMCDNTDITVLLALSREGLNFECYSTMETYRVFAPLSSGGYYCLDNSKGIDFYNGEPLGSLCTDPIAPEPAALN